MVLTHHHLPRLNGDPDRCRRREPVAKDVREFDRSPSVILLGGGDTERYDGPPSCRGVDRAASRLHLDRGDRPQPLEPSLGPFRILVGNDVCRQDGHKLALIAVLSLGRFGAVLTRRADLIASGQEPFMQGTNCRARGDSELVPQLDPEAVIRL
jgi:hypothetical protein